DIQDAIRAELIDEHDLPGSAVEVLGRTHGERIATLVASCVEASEDTFADDAPSIRLADDVLAATDVLREFMFARVYLHPSTLHEARGGQRIVEALFRYYEARREAIPGWSQLEDPPWRRAADYVSGMTDGYAEARARMLRLLPASE